jgi:serine O-acetyltransferase
VWLHRWSHYHFVRGNRLMARLLWHFNLNLTGADVSPLSNLGPGLVIIEPLACILLGTAGRNLTIRAHASFGGGMSREDIGAGPGLPLFGDDVELDFGAVVLGPLRVGSRTYVGPRCVVHTHLEEDARVLPPAPRIRKAIEAVPDRLVANA